jgi:hypothetical protein
MDRYTETPARQRVVEIMSGRPAGSLKTQEVNLMPVGADFNFTAKTAPGRGSFWDEHRVERIGASSWDHTKKKLARAVRAIVLLEHIGSPGAVAILKDMATGHRGAQPTKVAMEALKSLRIR